MVNREQVLIIEDNADLCELYRAGLSSYGYGPVSASDGPEGLATYDRLHCPIVLVDVGLPSAVTQNLNGYGVSTKIKAIDPGAIVIIITGMDDPMPDIRILDSHADRILTKPVTVDQIASEIEYIKAKKEAIHPRAAKAPGQLGGSWFSDKELMFAVVVIIWMLFTAVEMTLQWNQKAQIIKNQEDIISNQKLQILRIDDTREDLASYGMLNKNGPFGRKEESK
jgi:DNA-binding response OmpR family regulator